MQFPLSFWDLNLWLAITTIILLITSELVSPRYGETNLLIERKRLDRFTLVISILFLATVLARIFVIIVTYKP